MNVFERLGNALSAGIERMRFGGIQGVLKGRLKKFPVDSPQVHELISRATASAWRMRLVSAFFQRLGFSYNDYDTMYRAIVVAFPDRGFGDNLLATHMMVDGYDQLAPGFRSVAEIISITQGNNRAAALSKLVVDLVGESLPKSR